MAAKLIKNKCEIWTCGETQNLELHHIIPRTAVGCSNTNGNLAILCPNHHAAIDKNLTILGVVSSTLGPNNRVLVYILDGIKNIDIDPPKYQEINNKFII